MESPVAILTLLAAAGSCIAAVPADYKGKPFSDDFHQTGPPNIPGIVQCALYDLGGEGVAYHDTTPENEGSDRLNRQTTPYNHQRSHASDYIWHFRAQEGVDISYVKDWADLNHTNAVSPPINQLYIGWASDGEWVNYTVNVTEPGTYAVKCLYSYAEKEVHRDANGNKVGEISFDLNGKLAAICQLPRPTQGWHYWDYGQIATITFPEAGPQLLTFHYRRGNNWAFWVLEKVAGTVAITGKVTDVSGTPIPGVAVRLEKREGRRITDANGDFLLVSTGTAGQAESTGDFDDTISAIKDGYLDYEQPVVEQQASGLRLKMLVCADTVRDVDGNVYQAVKLGDQVWTTSNFRATRFSDGTAIPMEPATAAWKDNTTPLFCYPNNVTDPAVVKRLGLLYNFYAVDTKKLAPASWHVPSSAEWAAFEKYMIGAGFNWDGSTSEDKIAKAISAKTGWNPSTVQGAIGNDLAKNNTSGFSAYGSGFRHESGLFEPFGNYTGWWTATAVSHDHAGMIDLHANQAGWSNAHHYRSACGYSIRLVRDR